MLFHTAAVPAAGHLPIDVQAQHIDMLSLSGHKFHGPKGVGALYVRGGIPLVNVIEGGAQERGKRAGTENVPGIAVPQDMIDRLAAAAAEGKEKGVKGLPMQLGIEMAAEMIAKIKDEHLCDGVHIMAIGAEKNVPAILEKAGVTI